MANRASLTHRVIAVCALVTPVALASGCAFDPPGASPRLCNPDDEALVACFQFEGEIADESRQAAPARAADVAFTAGVEGDALLASPTSRVDLSENAALDVAAFTIATWVRVDATPAGERSGIFDNNGQYGLFLYADGRLRCSGGGLEVFAPDAFELGVWSHVTCTYTGQVMTLYLDGAEAAAGTDGDALFLDGASGASIGGDNPDGDPLVGAIDSFQMWNRAVDPSAITAIAASVAP